MLCGELLNGGFVSAGAVPVVPYSLPGLWLPGCLRATSPRLLTSPYLTLLAELLAAGRLELRDDFLELMDLANRSHLAPGNNGAPELDLHADDIDEIFLGKYLPLHLKNISHFNQMINEKSNSSASCSSNRSSVVTATKSFDMFQHLGC